MSHDRMKLVESQPRDRRRRGRIRRLRKIAVLPTLLTLGNLLCGFAAVYFCMLGIFDAAANIDPHAKSTLNSLFMEKFLPTFISVGGFLILLGLFFDAMDGRIARMTTGTTNFGGQLDSLADMVTFGVAPAMLMIAVVTMHTKRPDAAVLVSTKEAWLAGAIFVSCCAMRLARFNVEHAEGDLKHRSFHGLPSPGAASVLASLVILHEYIVEFGNVPLGKRILLNALPIAAMLAGLLMVSRIRYVHVANTYLSGRRPFGYVVVALIIAALFIRFPAPTLVILASVYALSGPVRGIWRRIHPRTAGPPSSAALDETDEGVKKSRSGSASR